MFQLKNCNSAGGKVKKLISIYLLVFLLGGNLFAASTEDDINAATSKIMPQVIKWRRYIHEHPELSNREVNTAKLVADELKKLGLEYRTERVPYRRANRPEIVELTGLRYVPVLVDGDEIVNDSHRIRQYLAWKYGEEEQRPEADSPAAG